MRLPLVLLSIAILSLLFMAILYYIDVYILSPIDTSTARIDTTGAGVEKIVIPVPDNQTDIIITWNTTTGDIIFETTEGSGKVFAHVPPDTVVAMSNKSWSGYLINDGSDGEPIVSPYREYEISPGEYYWSIVTRPRPVKDVYSGVLSFFDWIPLILGVVILVIVMYSERR